MSLYHVISSDLDIAVGTMARVVLEGPCSLAEINGCDRDHVLFSFHAVAKPVLYAEIRKLSFGWNVRIMRRNEWGDSFSRSDWKFQLTRGFAEAWAAAKIERLTRPKAPADIFVPELVDG